MNWSELVGTKVQLPPPSHEATVEPAASLNAANLANSANLASSASSADSANSADSTSSARAPAKSSRNSKSAATRENPLFAGSSNQPAEVPPALPGSAGSQTVSSLLTVPTLMNLTFATTVITLLWKLIQRWFGSAAGQWVPLLCCLLFVGLSWLLSYGTARTNASTKLVTAFVAVLTGLILTAAVIGIDVAILRPAP